MSVSRQPHEAVMTSLTRAAVAVGHTRTILEPPDTLELGGARAAQPRQPVPPTAAGPVTAENPIPAGSFGVTQGSQTTPCGQS